MAADAFLSHAVNGVNDSTDLANPAQNCTAQDIKIATADIESFSFDGVNFTQYTGQPIECNENDPIFVQLKAHVKETATSERTDIGVWIASQGGNARTGKCNQYNLIAPPTQSDTASINGVFNIDGDHCGDMNNSSEALVELGVINAVCKTATDTSNFVHVGSCIGWTQPGGDQTCPQNNSETDNGYRWGTVPGTTSKCNCGGFDISVTVRKLAKLEVDKVCDPTTDTGTFDLLIDGGNGGVGGFGDNKACGTNTGAQVLGAGTNKNPGAAHSFGEGDFTTANYTSSYSCVNRSASGPQHVFGTNGDAGATGTSLGPNQITLQPNEDVICTYTNVRKPSLTIVKRIVNDNGGTAVVGDFGITTTAGALTFGSGVADGANTLKYTSNTITLAAGSYSLHEGTLTGYTEGTWSCTAGNVTNTTPSSGSVTLANGDNAVCTITNNDQGATLQLVKRIVNDNGGTAVVGDFGITTTGGALTFGAGVADGANTLKYSSNVLNVNAGSYSLHEGTLTGYTEGTWSCTAGNVTNTTPSGGSVTLGLGQSAVCTITNDDQTGSLILVKRIVNDNGGTAVVGDFGITTTGGALTFGAGVADGANTLKYTSNTLTVNAGTYSLHEGTLTGYAEGSWSCTSGLVSGNAQTGSVAVTNGGSVTCTITNDDSPASLILVKRIVNDNGGTAVVGDFGITTTGGALTFGAGVADGANTLKYTSNTLSVSAGTYSLHEGTLTGYTEGTWSCTSGLVSGNAQTGSVAVTNGGSVTCTITNDDQQGSLILVKRIVNDNGGTAVVGDFGITTTGGALTFGAGVADGANTLKYTSNTLTVNAGTYSLHEGTLTGYAEGSWSCTSGLVSGNAQTGSVAVTNGGSVTCTITNDDQQGSLILVKRIVNDNGGTKVVGDFGITTTGGALTFGAGVADGANTLKYTSNTLSVNAGTYSLHEGTLTGYTEGTWSCTSGLVSGDAQAGSVAVTNGGTVTCTITNNDQPGTLILVKRIVNDNGGTAVVGAFGITTTGGALTFGAGVADGANTLKYTSNSLTVNAGTYSLHEGTLAGYSEGTWSCTSGLVSGNAQTGSVAVTNGGSVTCTITNNDIPAVLILVKAVKGAGATFNFNLTGAGLPASVGLTPATDGRDSVIYSGLSVGTRTITEIVTSGYLLTDLGCSDQPVGTYDPTVTQTVSTTLTLADTVKCTYTNQQHVSQTTRTQGFWATHRILTDSVWFGGTVGGNTFTGVTNKYFCPAKVFDTEGKLLGGFWSSISNTSTKTKRSSIDQARMQLAQQLLAAILNNAAFGSSPTGGISIDQAKTAFCTGTESQIQAAMQAMAAFNTGGDNGTFTPGISANGKDAKDHANIPFWDILP